MRLSRLPGVSNILAVARREFIARARTRAFMVTTLVLVLAAAVVGIAPVLINYFTRDSTRVVVYVGATDLRGDPIATLDALLNPPSKAGASAADTRKAFVVTRSTDLAADRQAVLDGKLNSLLDVERDPGGELVFTVYTKQPSDSRTVAISRQAATSIALADRLGRNGISAADQAALFAAPQVVIRSPDL
jgi:ABC-type Na+ efflux pump permease subunit